MVDLSKMTKWDLGKCFDHSVLPKNTTEADIRSGCEEAIKYNCAAFYPSTNYWLPVTTEMLKGTGVLAATTFDFPFGTGTPTAKGYMAEEAVKLGAQAIDMVMNIGAAKSGEWDTVLKDIQAVVAASKGKALVKVIIECCLLTDEEKVKASQVSKLAGADFVKTSTGFSTGGATVEDIRLMRATVGPTMGVKASGGVRTKADAEAMIAAGASRIGASSSKGIV